MKALIIFVSLLFSGFAGASEVADNITNAGKLFIAIGYMVGLILFIGSLYDFYLSGKYGNDPSRSVGAAFSKMLAGVLLLLSATAYAITKGSIDPTWTMTNDNLALSPNALDSIKTVGFLGYLPDSTVKSLFALIWLIGLFGFLKGLYLIRFSADQTNGGQGYNPVTKIATHMIGGVILMNIKDASNLVGSFFGWDWIKL